MAQEPASPPAALVIPHFVEVGDASGITFIHISGGIEEKPYIFETKGGGIGALDYDGDGWIDLFLVQGSTVERSLAGDDPHGMLLRNRGDWTFEDVTAAAGITHGAWGMGVTAADIDNDGLLDLYLTNLGPNFCYHNNGDGTFTEVAGKLGLADPRWSTSAAFADYDADGLLDLFIPNYLDVSPHKLPMTNPLCQYRNVSVMCGPRGLPGAADALLHHNPDGTFSDVSRTSGVFDEEKLFGLGSVWGDLDNDGDLDLYVANDATPNALYVNQGGGVFEDYSFMSGLAVSIDGSEQASMGVDLADYDNSGRLAVYCTHFASDYSTLYRNDGNLEFQDATAAAKLMASEHSCISWGTRFVDLNHDGWKDIFHANGHVYPFIERKPELNEHFRQPHTLYLNNHRGQFVDASEQAGFDLRHGALGRGVAFADFDNDGDIDIAIANMNGSPQLFRNDLDSKNHWVMFRTRGRHSNRDGIGARLTVITGDLTQIWEIKRTVGIYSCSDPRAHFGLGAATSIDKLVVRWPRGEVQEFTDLAVDRHYLVDEAAGLSEEQIKR